jgi:hypothetical protein
MRRQCSFIDIFLAFPTFMELPEICNNVYNKQMHNDVNAIKQNAAQI